MVRACPVWYRCLSGTVLLGLASLALGQAAAPLDAAALAACRSIAERELRYECYDRVEAGAAAAIAPAPAVEPQRALAAPAPPAAPAGADAPRDSELADFGRVSRVERNSDTGEQELVDRVRELKLVQHNQWQITLESGQVWRQMLSSTFNLKPGHEVRIRRIGDGPNYRLSSPQLSGFIQVRRVL